MSGDIKDNVVILTPAQKKWLADVAWISKKHQEFRKLNFTTKTFQGWIVDELRRF